MAVHAAQLSEAAFTGNNLKLRELLADPVSKDQINVGVNAHNHSSLFYACYGGADAETVNLLLKAGADPWQRDASGHLPLHLAAHSNDPEVIAALLEVPNMQEFKLDATGAHGQTPLHALFLPGSGIGATVKAKNADLSKCLSLFLEVGRDPLGALHKRNDNGVSSLMLVKHRNLQTAFHPHVAPKTFELLLRKFVTVPGNIEELIKVDFYAAIEQLPADVHNSGVNDRQINNTRPRW